MPAKIIPMPADRRRRPEVETHPPGGLIIGILLTVIACVVLLGVVAGVWQY